MKKFLIIMICTVFFGLFVAVGWARAGESKLELKARYADIIIQEEDLGQRFNKLKADYDVKVAPLQNEYQNLEKEKAEVKKKLAGIDKAESEKKGKEGKK